MGFLAALLLAASPSGCGAATTKALIADFVSAYNAGHAAQAARYFAPTPTFRWFSTGPPATRNGEASHARSTLLAYFRNRAGHHERIRIVKLGAGYDPARDIVNFGGKLTRRADDGRTPVKDFKGAADCLTGSPRLIVWSM